MSNQQKNMAVPRPGTAMESGASYWLSEGWVFRELGGSEWLPAVVPGNNYSDLFRAKAIPDPFYREHENKVQWVAERDWEYKLGFTAGPDLLAHQCQLLDFHGLDTYASVWLNGRHLLDSQNMFLRHQVDVSGWLQPGSNELRIVFRSPLKEVRGRAAAAGLVYPAGNDHSEEKLSVFSRKAPYHYGWDWGPRFVTSGIWRGVQLLGYSCVRIQHQDLSTLELLPQGGRVLASLELEVAEPGEYLVRLDIGQGQWAFDFPISCEKGTQHFSFELELPGAAYWWPKGYGEARLYEVEWRVAGSTGATFAAARSRFGMRTARLIRKPDEHGRSFYFEINGQPVFALGANYIPQDSFLDQAGPERYRQCFDDMEAAHFNMVRIWGGGIYEEGLFYDLADERGIMVWQDFMFACTMYPGDEAFLDNVAKEAVYNIKRLKAHPSVVLWCGNNEIGVGWEHWGWQETYGYSPVQCEQLKADYDRLFHGLLPELVAGHAPGIDYLPSSPMIDYSEISRYADGDVHYWGVWHEEAPFETYQDAVPRFMSEYGFQSFPLLESVKRYTSPEDWGLESPVMQLHQKHPRGNGIIRKYLMEAYAPPQSFEAFLYLSQVLQAEGIRMAIEAHRAAKPFCMGTLYWQLNDCWPVASWSGIDYYGRWKALHYHVRQAYQPVIGVLDVRRAVWKAVFIKDEAGDQQVTARLGLYSIAGKRHWMAEHRLRVGPEANTVWEVPELQQESEGLEKGQRFVRLEVLREGTVVYDRIIWLDKPKELQLRPPEVLWRLEQGEGHLTATLSSSNLVKNLYVQLEGVEANASDNFFDLFPGEEKTIRWALRAGETPGQLTWLSVFEACQKNESA
ncbi:beta-mannosidase [Phaeodactylibacter luteus]|uniref:beta-mannosidase n=1 Tax=Phaeodactylibacter luteus TaxID=1564516 RepID=A0A5C6RYR4_9BACT|nr:glycoside hydrolase family 2 protein [Phaeodactylibacter luteus]TXB66512.1 glycoside hydrolase family 2 protein [Phaeodactylibacter luteus]